MWKPILHHTEPNYNRATKQQVPSQTNNKNKYMKISDDQNEE